MELRHLMDDQIWTHIVQDESLSAVDIGNYVRLRPRAGHGNESLRAKSRRLNVSVETLRRSVHSLEAAGWVELYRSGSSLFAVPWMPNHVEEEIVRILQVVREDVKYFGQWLMHCFLTILVVDTFYIDEARPRWLVTSLGSGRYELDRWYRPAKVAFEFQGSQHFTTGADFVTTQEELVAQQQRDGLKRSMLEQRNITLVPVHIQDLRYDRLREMIPPGLTMTPRKNKGPIVEALSNMAISYINDAMKRAQRDI